MAWHPKFIDFGIFIRQKNCLPKVKVLQNSMHGFDYVTTTNKRDDNTKSTQKKKLFSASNRFRGRHTRDAIYDIYADFCAVGADAVTGKLNVAHRRPNTHTLMIIACASCASDTQRKRENQTCSNVFEMRDTINIHRFNINTQYNLF